MSEDSPHIAMQRAHQHLCVALVYLLHINIKHQSDRRYIHQTGFRQVGEDIVRAALILLLRAE